MLKAETVNLRLRGSAIYKRVAARDTGSLRHLNMRLHSKFLNLSSTLVRDPVSSTGKSPFVALRVIFLEPCKNFLETFHLNRF